jgi:hypothetical protein
MADVTAHHRRVGFHLVRRVIHDGCWLVGVTGGGKAGGPKPSGVVVRTALR